MTILAYSATLKICCNQRSGLFFPAGNISTASSRLRIYSLLDNMTYCKKVDPDQGIFLDNAESKFLWFQKVLTERHLDIAETFKALGSKIIYDCDESGVDLTFWAQPNLVFRMLHLADYVTADTPERINWLKKSGSLARFRLIENEIDTFCRPPRSTNQYNRQDSNTLRIIWFGNPRNFASVSKFLQQVPANDQFVIVICGADSAEVFRYLPNHQIEVFEWDLGAFPDILSSCDISVLSHLGTWSDSHKSAHKMITSICHGVPALVSKTPDYLRVARWLGLDDYTFLHEDDFKRILKNMYSKESRSAYIDKALPPLRSRFAVGSFSHNAIKILTELYQTRRNNFRFYQKMLLKRQFLRIKTIYNFLGSTYWACLQNLLR
jgi:hypothetical protein